MVNFPDPEDSSEELKILECVPSEKSSGFFEDWEGMSEGIKRKLNAITAQVKAEYDPVMRNIHDLSLLGQFRPIKLEERKVSLTDEETVEKPLADEEILEELNRIMNDPEVRERVKETLEKVGIKRQRNCPGCRWRRILEKSAEMGPIGSAVVHNEVNGIPALDEEIVIPEIELSNGDCGFFEHWPGLTKEEKTQLHKALRDDPERQKFKRLVKGIEELAAYGFNDPTIYR